MSYFNRNLLRKDVAVKKREIMLFIRGLIVAKLLAVAFAAGSITQEIAITKSITGAHVRILAYHVSFQVEKSC